MNKPITQNFPKMEPFEPVPTDLGQRAFLAVTLMLGFYLLALVIIILLVYVPLALITEGKFPAALIVFCFGGAWVVFKSVLPQKDRFELPGPLLEPVEQPKLFKTLDEVADATNQKMLTEVFLVPELNAWVSQRRGMMGFGSRRVMGIGLPLLEVLSVSQLRAVLAHEFGHFHAGDTRLGPWVYKTRAAIERTIVGLARHSALLQKPFIWYGRAFLRITLAVSRQQELSADRLAARVAGAQALAGGLKNIHGYTPAFNGFWFNEFAPVLNSGFYPSFMEGFHRYVRAPRVEASVARGLSYELASEFFNPYDTHPSLRDRVTTLEAYPARDFPRDESPAISLLDNADTLESRLIAFLGGETAGKLKPISWGEVGDKVWKGIWEKHAQEYIHGLKGITPADFPRIFKDFNEFAERLKKIDRQALLPEERLGLAELTLRRALAAALLRKGWELSYFSPGQDYVLKKGELTLTPSEWVWKLVSGELTPQIWQEECRRLGIDDLDLGDLPSQKAPDGNSEAGSKEGH